MSSANSISLFIFIIHKQGRYKKYVAISYEGVVYLWENSISKWLYVNTC